METFSDFTEEVLKESGWTRDRDVSGILRKWERELKNSDGFELFPAAKEALSSFGGLSVNHSGPGKECACEPFRIIPTLAIYEGDGFTDFSRCLGKLLYPLGEACAGNAFLAIAEDGRVFLLMQDIRFLAKSIEEALENLITGINSQVCSAEEFSRNGLQNDIA